MNQNPTKFGSHRYCGKRDVIILVCDVIQQDHLTKGQSNMDENPLKLFTELPNWVVIGTMVVEI